MFARILNIFCSHVFIRCIFQSKYIFCVIELQIWYVISCYHCAVCNNAFALVNLLYFSQYGAELHMLSTVVFLRRNVEEDRVQNLQGKKAQALAQIQLTVKVFHRQIVQMNGCLIMLTRNTTQVHFY